MHGLSVRRAIVHRRDFGVAIDQGPQVHRMPHAAYFVLDLGKQRAGIRVDDTNEAELMVQERVRDESALLQESMRLGNAKIGELTRRKTRVARP